MSNIEKRSGKSLAELTELIRTSGLAKHGEIRDMLKRDLGMGHGDANTLTTVVLASASAPVAEADPYEGAKAALRPIHDALMAKINGFGEFEIAPKKGYISLRRKRQFAMIGPATNTRVEVGLNMKAEGMPARLEVLPPKGMCPFRVKVTEVEQVDAELIGWIRMAYEQAG